MESIEQYYSSRTRLIVSSVLLITWEFFGKEIKTDIDFEYLNISIAAEAIPFLLALLTLYNTYTFAFHWKLIESSKKPKLSTIDYYLILLFSFFTLAVNYFYQIQQSNSSKFLSATMEGTFTVSSFLLMSVFTYLSRKYDGNEAKLISPLWQFYMGLIFLGLSLIGLGYEVYKYKNFYKLNNYEAAYFYSFYLISIFIFGWAAAPSKRKDSNL